MPRCLLIVLDSVGCGAAPDAAAYGDEGADTLGHIALAACEGRADRTGLREGALRVPHLAALGLVQAAASATGRPLAGVPAPARPLALHGCATEISQGKDTPSGHWEIAGVPVPFAWGYFPATRPSFPPELTRAIVAVGGLPGILGDCHASGTAIIDELGAESMRTGKPICYTSVDSVLQIAAHEEAFGLVRLHELCAAVRPLVDDLRIGRVIARPFVGSAETGFQRTANRKDFAIPPPGVTLLDRAAQAGRQIITIGKIGDIFAHRNTGSERKGASNEAHVDMACTALDSAGDGALIFVNLVDFDTEYGHRRDVAGYAAALEAFDRRLPDLMARLHPEDLMVLTADHGNDPTFPGTDHTREYVPVLAFGTGIAPRALGRRGSFADIGQSIARHLGLVPLASGLAWQDDLAG